MKVHAEYSVWLNGGVRVAMMVAVALGLGGEHPDVVVARCVLLLLRVPQSYAPTPKRILNSPAMRAVYLLMMMALAKDIRHYTRRATAHSHSSAHREAPPSGAQEEHQKQKTDYHHSHTKYYIFQPEQIKRWKW